MLNVFCIWIGNNYSLEAVLRLRQMVKDNLTLEHRFICLSEKFNQYRGKEGLVGDIIFESPYIALQDSFARLNLFVPQYKYNKGYEGKCLFISLESIIVSNIDAMVKRHSDITLAKVGSKYVSDVMIWDIEMRSALYKSFNNKELDGHIDNYLNKKFKGYGKKGLDKRPAESDIGRVNFIDNFPALSVQDYKDNIKGVSNEAKIVIMREAQDIKLLSNINKELDSCKYKEVDKKELKTRVRNQIGRESGWIIERLTDALR